MAQAVTAVLVGRNGKPLSVRQAAKEFGVNASSLGEKVAAERRRQGELPSEPLTREQAVARASDAIQEQRAAEADEYVEMALSLLVDEQHAVRAQLAVGRQILESIQSGKEIRFNPVTAHVARELINDGSAAVDRIVSRIKGLIVEAVRPGDEPAEHGGDRSLGDSSGPDVQRVVSDDAS